MSKGKFGRLVGVALATIAALGLATAAEAQQKKIKIGVIYDLTGPFAGAGSELQYTGAKIMMDYFNKNGGVEGYQIEPIYADAQSKPDIAINEAVRLIEHEHVDMLLGFYSSAQCVPAAARIEQLKKFMWITTCISSAVLENRHLKYVFRAQPSGRQFGLMSTDFLAQNAKTKLGKDPKDLRVAIIHEDGAYGVDVSKGNEEGARKAGFNIVLKEGYAATAPDLASLVTKLKRARPDVIFHTGHLALPAAGARARPPVQRPDRPRGRLRGLRQAEGGARQGRQLLLQRGPDLDLARQRQGPQARAAAPDQDGGRGVREGPAGHHRPLGPRGNGGEQHLRAHDRGAAAGHQEVRRDRRRLAPQGRARGQS